MQLGTQVIAVLQYADLHAKIQVCRPFQAKSCQWAKTFKWFEDVNVTKSTDSFGKSFMNGQWWFQVCSSTFEHDQNAINKSTDMF